MKRQIKNIIIYNKTNKDDNAIKEISDLTIEILNCNDLNQFEKIIEEHEKIISFSIKLKPIKENYFYVGRGSGANSIVAYLLNITNVDPVDLDLYFERFR